MSFAKLGWKLVSLWGIGLWILVLAGCSHPGTHFSMRSPDGTIRVLLDAVQGTPEYAVILDTTWILRPSRLGILQRGETVRPEGRLVFLGKKREESVWEQPWGEDRVVHDRHNRFDFALLATTGDTLYQICFKVFDDAVAFRYTVDVPPDDSLYITAEGTEFNFAGNGEMWWTPNDWDSYEHLYRQTTIREAQGVNTPVTVRTPGGPILSIHEAALVDYAGMTLVPDQAGSLDWEVDLVPWPDEIKVRSLGSLTTPWRVLLLGREDRDLANSNTLLSLNEPSRIEDVSWIRPMKYMGVWWSLHIKRETWFQGPRHGAATANVRRYIDFAAEHDIPGLLVEGWNRGWEDWQFDLTQPYDDFDEESLAAYAREKGVSLIRHLETGADAAMFEPLADKVFQRTAELGIHAAKTGYVGQILPRGQHHHGQWMVRHYQRMVETAARHRIMLDVHEPIKPTGLRRTWPNMMTREGVRGGEYDAWSEGNPPAHTTILPFTRCLAGPVDYTPGIFQILFGGRDGKYRVHTTLAKQLALMVVLYSPLQMAADLPENYANHPAFEFIRHLQVDVDESSMLDGKIGEYAVTARRAGAVWFLGAVTNEETRNLKVPLRFLDAGKRYRCLLYCDGPETDWKLNPMEYKIEEMTVDRDSNLELRLASGGGCAVHLTPLSQAGGTP